MQPDVQTEADLRRIVAQELVQFKTVPAAASELAQFLIEPYLLQLGWDYGEPEEKRGCWIVAVFPDNSAIGYSESGFSTPYFWGRIAPSMRGFGGDSAWFSSLEDCFLETKFWTGQLPNGYEVR